MIIFKNVKIIGHKNKKQNIDKERRWGDFDCL